MHGTLQRLSAILSATTLAIVASAASAQNPVQNGIDVLRAEGFAQLHGRKVGLITNHTGLALDGKSTPVLLHEHEKVQLVALFSPEHGFAGKLEGKVGDSRHAETGLPIYSLYGKDRKPSKQSLRGVDTLVFDIQDIGCRFYTYIATMGEAMQVAAQEKKRFVVLDRPNPIGGVDVGGAMRDPDDQSFIAWHTIPVRHGMTVGELARMFKEERNIDCELRVVKMKGWRRDMYFDATGQVWVNPSPNMRSPVQALLYPGVGLLEFTNLSVGRGTDTPFELIGAPWMDGRKLSAALNAADLPGLRSVPIAFTPDASKHKDKLCHGVRFWVTNRASFDPVRLGVQLAYELRRLHPDAWEHKRYARLLANQGVFRAVIDGQRPAATLQGFERDLAPFYRRRLRHLLY